MLAISVIQFWTRNFAYEYQNDPGAMMNQSSSDASENLNHPRITRINLEIPTLQESQSGAPLRFV